MGRIYALDDSLDKLVNDKKFQIKIIGENSYWSYEVSYRKWDDNLQRYTYTYIGGGTCSKFLKAYDYIVQMIVNYNE